MLPNRSPEIIGISYFQEDSLGWYALLVRVMILMAVKAKKIPNGI
jgi:hypothetical protein